MRVLILSHGHPNFSKGGGELAAYHLFNGINDTAANEAWFVGRAPQELLHLGTPISGVNPREFLISGNADIHNLTATIPLGKDSDFAVLLRSIRPDVIHFHHYFHLGLEMIYAAKRTCPTASIVLTLHEYIAICLNNGQMTKTDGRLCYRYSPRECHLCYPELTPEDFFLREQYIKSFFRIVDAFVSPSCFLKDRYVAWGISEDKISIIENGLPAGHRVPLQPLVANEKRTRFAYFGQINPFKGVDVILEAFVNLSLKERKQVTLDLFGSALNYQSAEFQAKISSLLDRLKGVARMHGPYEPEEMGRLMGEVDWVIMGSVWWENSPLVIQEAFKFGRPVICPDIGGMAEKVQPGVGGLNYRARDSISLSTVVSRIIDDAGIHSSICESLPSYTSVEDSTNTHIDLYQRLNSSSKSL